MHRCQVKIGWVQGSVTATGRNFVYQTISVSNINNYTPQKHSRLFIPHVVNIQTVLGQENPEESFKEVNYGLKSCQLFWIFGKIGAKLGANYLNKLMVCTSRYKWMFTPPSGDDEFQIAVVGKFVLLRKSRRLKDSLVVSKLCFQGT